MIETFKDAQLVIEFETDLKSPENIFFLDQKKQKPVLKLKRFSELDQKNTLP